MRGKSHNNAMQADKADLSRLLLAQSRARSALPLIAGVMRRAHEDRSGNGLATKCAALGTSLSTCGPIRKESHHISLRSHGVRDMKSGQIFIFFACVAISIKVGGQELPPFVSELIETYEAETDGLVSPVEIWQYEYEGERVFYLPLARSYCCDIPSVLYSVRGELICRPDGGFTGDGDGRCPNFVARQAAGVLVWRGPDIQQHPEVAADEAVSTGLELRH
jgi:hypothetical protein